MRLPTAATATAGNDDADSSGARTIVSREAIPVP